MNDSFTPAVQDFYPDDFAHCYGCGRLNPDGLQLKTRWGDANGETITRFTPSMAQVAVPGFVYGGLIASLIDCHAMATAAAATLGAAGRAIGDGPAPRFVTAALHVDFVAPTPFGPELVVRGRVKTLSERKAVIEASVSVDERVTARGEVVAVRMPDTMKRG